MDNLIIEDGVLKGVTDKSITSAVIPDGVTSIGQGAFSQCTALTSVIIPNSVTSIKNIAFDCCFSLASIIIPDSVTSIGNSAFFQCKELASITIPDSVTSIGNSAFNYCFSLNNVTIPSKVTSIIDGTFSHCQSLTSITIPDGITAIGAYAFNTCTRLTSITIPASVTSIGEYAFGDCSELTDITILNGNISIESDAFKACPKLKTIITPSPENIDREYSKIKKSVKILTPEQLAEKARSKPKDSVKKLNEYLVYSDEESIEDFSILACESTEMAYQAIDVLGKNGIFFPKLSIKKISVNEKLKDKGMLIISNLDSYKLTSKIFEAIDSSAIENYMNSCSFETDGGPVFKLNTYIISLYRLFPYDSEGDFQKLLSSYKNNEGVIELPVSKLSELVDNMHVIEDLKSIGISTGFMDENNNIYPIDIIYDTSTAENNNSKDTDKIK